MNTKKIYVLSITLLAIVVFIVACTGEAQQPVEEQETDRAEESQAPAEETEPIEEVTAAPELIGTTWQWIRFDDMGEINNLEVEDPVAYTLLLDADGLYHLKADCNMVSGAYVLDGSSLSFEPGLTTLAECGPDSHYRRYLTHIGNVATYVMEDGTLYLNLWADGGNMVFEAAK